MRVCLRGVVNEGGEECSDQEISLSHASMCVHEEEEKKTDANRGAADAITHATSRECVFASVSRWGHAI